MNLMSSRVSHGIDLFTHLVVHKQSRRSHSDDATLRIPFVEGTDVTQTDVSLASLWQRRGCPSFAAVRNWTHQYIALDLWDQ
jgi:hypothetical protein